jgi:hypothetical protein
LSSDEAPWDYEMADAARLFLVAQIAKEFGQLPSVVARDLDNDPEQLSVICRELLAYSDAKSVFDRSNKQEHAAYEGSPMFEAVKAYEFERTAAALKGEQG